MAKMMKLFGILIMALSMIHAQTTQYSGGIYLGKSLYDMTGNDIIGEFPPSTVHFGYTINYLEVWLEDNWYYFSYLNNSKCLIARSRPDFSNFQFVTKTSFSSFSNICQFSIDKVNNYLYYASGNNLMRSQPNGEDAQVISNPIGEYYNTMTVLGTQMDVVTRAIWYFGGGETYSKEPIYSFFAYYPNNNTVEAFSLPVNFLIDTFIVFDDYVYFFSGGIYQCSKSSAGECNPVKIVSANSMGFDLQTQKIYYLTSTYSNPSLYYYLCNFYYETKSSEFPTDCSLQNQPKDGYYYTTILPMKCEKGCSSNGNCIETNSQFNCSCFLFYFGPSCDIYCDSSINCTFNGYCNAENGECMCDTDFYGSNCGIYCDETQTCTENGICSDEGDCICNEYYSGSSCTVPVISPTTPSLFSADALLSDDQTKLIVYYSYQSQQLVLNFTSYLIYKEFNSGYEYNVTASSCVRSELYFASFPLIQPTSTSHLTYWNGTANECVDGSISKWVDDINTPKSNLTLLQDCSSPNQYLPSFIEWNPYSLVFDVSSFSYSPPSSIFKIPSICFNS